MEPHVYHLASSQRALLKDLGVEPGDVLRLAGLPHDLFARESARLTSDEYYRLWAGLEAALGERSAAVALAEALRGDWFTPPMFAALASPCLAVAVERIARYKPLIAPIRLDTRIDADALSIELSWLDASRPPPPSLVAMELLFFVGLARLGTRERIRPRRAIARELPDGVEQATEFLGVPLERGDAHRVVFELADAQRPFLTSNDAMWAAFEPELRRRLAEVDATASTEERVRAALLEGLPSGQVAVDSVAKRLGMSKRTLQRRLEGDGTSYQRVLSETREALARHYLAKTTLATAEIAFLLGFEEPNSFFRAFSDWTGQTPDAVRRSSHPS
ncbi:MAG: AraC family transcriptional regulator ligand-binding domain-containing protein [Sandaracinaceae bacterium]